ncbi:uncharacterized protein LOC118746562 [Rhagoletis pomonella]|uniref:uncharacterized protein LOC118746562 n=1 Tax=Rhagoletis pomonella TaxID=28610 RepID=UPI0017825E03|nr:uncharacterized protein LOC118746562 [Rhagoletis pomonella]
MWMYTAIIRPILTYGALVWWPALDKQYNVSKLNSLQRAACSGTTGALKSCPSEALNVILNMMPIDLCLKEAAMYSALRLRESGLWGSRTFGHSSILGLTSIGNKTTDYMVSTLDFGLNVQVRFPSRREWKRGQAADREAICIYTDGSKMDCGVGTGVYSEELGVNRSLRLENHASIFQAEVLGICEACRILRNSATRKERAVIYSDSQAALLAISSTVTKSKLVKECKMELRSASQSMYISLIWVPGHMNI